MEDLLLEMTHLSFLGGMVVFFGLIKRWFGDDLFILLVGDDPFILYVGLNGK